MSLDQVNSAFNLLGQLREPAEAVRLPGPRQPTLQIAWGVFRQSAASNLAAIFSGPSYARKYVYKGFFKDVWIEGRVPRLALCIALLLHLALLVTPFPRALTALRRNPAFDNVELTWSGPINDLPLLNMSSTPPKAAARSKTSAPHVAAAVPQGADAFHPRQRIFTDAAQLTHPRQTLINSAAPAVAPKILPSLPNIVELQQAAAPVRPRLEINEQALAKLHPRERRVAASPAATPSDTPLFQQQTADVAMLMVQNGPERPKLSLNAGAAPRVVQRAKTGDVSAAPEIAATSPAGASPATLIALSAAPAPPAATVAVPQGNLAARVAISPEGKQPGSPSGMPSVAVVPSAGSSGTGGGNTTSPVSISISGGTPIAKNNVSGLGGSGASPKGTAKFSLTSPHDMLAHSTHAEMEDAPVRTGPPNFAALPPGAKPEQVFNTKKIYTLYVNMPNLNSTTGSWVLNFSELRPSGAGSHFAATNLSSPVPTKKVDPKYPPTLANDHVEGEIVLYAVIRRDGSIDSIQLVHGLDQQLDSNSMSALAQWTFRPATREDQPVELEAIIHIPFHATPKE
jgi:TonB family protein